MKQITIIGNLGANAVRRTASDGRELMTFSVAVSAGQSTTWFNAVGAFREKVFPYLVKGQCICAIGDLSAAIFKDRIDLTVNIDRVELCGKAPETTPKEEPSSHSQSFDAANQQVL